MKRSRKSFANGLPRGGFTLIELLVVIGIIVIMAAITVPAVRALGQGNGRSQAINSARTMITHARSVAISQHRMAGVVFFEEGDRDGNGKAYSSPINSNQTAMQIFVEDYNQIQYDPGVGNTVFVAYSSARQYLPSGIKAVALNDDPARGVMTGDDPSASNGRGTTRAVLFDAQGQLVLRHGLARPDVGMGSPGTFPRASGDWHFTTKRGGPHLGVSTPGIMLVDMSQYLDQHLPSDESGDAARNQWIKQHADVVIVNAYTGNFIQ